MAKSILTKNPFDWLTLHGARETVFFSREGGALVQWIELDLSCRTWRPRLEIEITSGGRTARREVVIFPREREKPVTVRAHAPALWPAGPDHKARLVIRSAGKAAEGCITVGSHRPWTVYLLSDLCADDSWAYDDLHSHDRDDYLTTREELAAGEENSYNMASAYQLERFWSKATGPEKRQAKEALAGGRLYVTPTPCQLLTGAFVLSAYPLLLEPYRTWAGSAGVAPEEFTRDGYHMEATTWTSGFANLLSCAGFRSFGKSLLQYQAPWLEELRKLPRLARLEAAPGRFMYLVLRCGGYSEGSPVLAGPPHVNDFLHGQVIPEHEALGREYPASAIPLVGSYSDLSPETPKWAAVKMRSVREYNSQGWEYPRLVNSTWPEFADHVERELGEPGSRSAARSGLRTVRGDTGSSWEVWMIAAQREAASFRACQRDLVSVRTLDAMLGGPGAAGAGLDEAALEVAYLGDHAWNGSGEGSKRLNLKIRRRRLAKVASIICSARDRMLGGLRGRPGETVAVVNTLAWDRECRVRLPAKLAAGIEFVDLETGHACRRFRDAGGVHMIVPGVPGFGPRVLETAKGGDPEGLPGPVESDDPLSSYSMRPLLAVGGREAKVSGGWRIGGRGRWRAGPFTINAALIPLGGMAELVLDVSGKPPAADAGYELRWLFDLPWKRVRWRGESGGGFVTPGPAAKGGDSLLGIAGSIFSAGEGLSVAPASGRASSRIDFAFGESGMCGLGGRTTAVARGTYGERHDGDALRGALMNSTATAGRLEWYLLSTGQNPREALIDQGGARKWRFRCAMRRCRGGFDDAELYRFAAGRDHPGEIVAAEAVELGAGPWLGIEPGGDVLFLGARREKRSLVIDLYNTSAKRSEVKLAGRGLAGRKLASADMLGRSGKTIRGGRLEIAPRAFARVVAT